MSTPIRLVIGSDLFKPSRGGTETVTENMATNLSKAGFRVTVIAPAPKDKKATPYLSDDDAGYEILRVKSYGLPIQKNLRFSRHAYRQIAEFLDKPHNRPDIIHVNNPFPTSKALIKYARRNHIPLVVGGHLMPESFTTSIRWTGGLQRAIDGLGWRYIARVYNKANMVVAPTQTALNYLLEHGLKVPTKAISNGIDLQADSPLKTDKAKLKHELGLQSKYVLVYAGRLGLEKRIDVIITAFSQIYQQYDVDLLLIGDGNAKLRLKNQVRKLFLKDRVVFTGYVQELEAKRRYLAASDIFAIASPVELQSIVTLEAMAAGLPILAVDEGALPELAVQGKNGGVFADGDAAGLARMIGHLLQDPILLKEYGQGSLQLIKQHDIRKTWKEYEQMYRDVIANFNHNRS